MDATVAMMVGMFAGMLLGVASTWAVQHVAEMRADEDGYARGLADGERAALRLAVRDEFTRDARQTAVLAAERAQAQQTAQRLRMAEARIEELQPVAEARTHVAMTALVAAVEAEVAYDLSIDVEAGELDLPALAMPRSFLAPDTRDWKVSHVLAEIGAAVLGGPELRAQLQARNAEIAELRQQLDAVQTQLRNRNADIAELRQHLARAQAEIAATPRGEIAELFDLLDNSSASLDCPAGWAVREWLDTFEGGA